MNNLSSNITNRQQKQNSFAYLSFIRDIIPKHTVGMKMIGP